MNEIIIKIANDLSAVLGMATGFVFWLFIMWLIFSRRG